MSSQFSDGLLWLGIGISLFFAVRGVAADLRRVRDLTEIKSREKEDRMISEGTEDGEGSWDVVFELGVVANGVVVLKLDTLLKLSESTSYDLRAAYALARALRIISERSTKGPTRDLLLSDLVSKDRNTRNKALNALYFLVSNRALSRTSVCARLRDISTYNALVECLCNFLEEHTEVTCTNISPILPTTRPVGEKKALNTLNIILQEDIAAALEAGVVSKWLSRYPFPCALDQPSRKQDLVILMKSWWTDDAVMSSIFSAISSNPDGKRQLRKYGLMGSMIEENDHDDDDDIDSDIWMIDGEDTAGSTRLSGPRVPEGTAEEQAVRRRRREAMVLSDGGHPLRQDDIIQYPLQNH